MTRILLYAGAGLAALAGVAWLAGCTLGQKPTRANPRRKKWSKGVKAKWHAPAGLFAKSPETIAEAVLAGHGHKLAPSVSSLNFYVNRAGSNLSDSARAKVLRARMIVQARGKPKHKGKSKFKGKPKRAAAN